MAKVEKDGDDLMLVFNEDELEKFGIEEGMNADVQAKDGRLLITFQKYVRAEEAQNFFMK